jgi:hypothetical protein
LRANRRASWLRHVAVGSTTMTWAPLERAATKRRRRGAGEEEASALCPSVAVATSRYNAVERSELPGGGVGEADLRHGGKLQRGRRQNRPAPVESCGGTGGEMNGAGEISSRCIFASVRTYATRPGWCKNRASQKICNAATDSCLLEGRFLLRAVHTGCFYSAHAR